MKLYLPFISKEDTSYYGVAFSNYECESDLELLKADWYYNWTPKKNNSNKYFIPMLWGGDISPDVDKNYSDYILCFNEPSVEVQGNLSVEKLKDKYLILRNYYTRAKLVMGGFSIFALNYYYNFLNLLNKEDYPQYIHVHTYVEEWVTKEFITNNLDYIYNCNPCEMWITEFNEVGGNLDDFSQLITILKSKPYIKKIAVYTNRQKGEWWNLPNASLIENGKLTDKGNIYITNR